MNKESELDKEEMVKFQSYLEDSKKNMERMKKGKKPRRKLKYFLIERKFTVAIILLLITTSPFLLFLRNQPVDTHYPYRDTITNTLNILESNFTLENGFPVLEKISENTSSELIILYSLTNSLLTECELITKDDNNLQKIAYIFEIIENDTFRNYEEKTIKLPVFYQFLGIYSLYQAYYVLLGTSYQFSFNIITNVINTTVNEFLRYTSWPYLYAVSEGTNTSYLVDQAFALSVLTTYMLISGYKEIYDWDLEEITEAMLDRIENRFYISSSQTFYHQYDIITYVGSGLSNSKDLMFTSYCLSRMEKYLANYSFPISSYNVHQNVITELVDSNWLVHENDRTDASILIENQAYFSLISSLLNLNNVGTEVKNATVTYMYSSLGFVAEEVSSDVTAESCLYGLLTVMAEDWGPIQNSREYYTQPRPTPSPTEYPQESNGFQIMITLITILTSVILTKIIIKTKKQKMKKLW